MKPLRIMSHNLWKCDKNNSDWEKKGFSCAAPVRALGFTRVYSETLPDIIGIQEASSLMINEIVTNLDIPNAKYGVIWGKDTPIFYRTDKLDVVDSEYFLYPESIPEYEGVFNNDKTKSWCLGVFRAKEDGKLLAFMSTHLWWMTNSQRPFSDEARAYQLSMASKRLQEYGKKYNCPCILVGDLNSTYSSPAISAALKTGLVHAHDVATDFADETQGTHYCFGNGFKEVYDNGGFAAAIDHILLTDDIEVKSFCRYSPEYYFPYSDHSPVFADIVIK